MEVTDIGGREDGKIWHRTLTSSKHGAFITVIRRSASHNKTVRFLQASFDSTGDSFLSGDRHGNIYLFDISRNRFKLVQKTAQACTALAFNSRRRTEFLVALADYSIKCFDIDSRQQVSWMRGHGGAVSSLSVHSSGHFAISTSSDAAQLWNLENFQRERKLNVRQSVGIQKVFFVPHSSTILSCFIDDSIFAWESETLSCKYELPVPPDTSRINYRAFAVSQDGKTLAAAGRSNLIHLWCLAAQQLIKVVQMSSDVRSVKHLDFLPDCLDGGSNQTLGILSQDGIMRFINIQSCKQVFEIGSHEDGISSATICPKGHHVVSVMDSGALRIYSVRNLTPETSKPLLESVTKDELRKKSCLKGKKQSASRQHPVRTSGRLIKSRDCLYSGPSLDYNQSDLPNGLSKKSLHSLLTAFGEYPSKYRMFIWRSLLALPENHAAFSDLTAKGLHPAHTRLQECYPIRSPKLQRGLQRVISALSHWAAVLSETDYLPLLAFPFVKLFPNNPLMCFEVVATIIMNWCQHWFDYFPNPPLNVLSLTENVLAHCDKELLQHFVLCGVTSQLYAWPLLETLFSEVLTSDEWLKLFDHVFSKHPSFLLIAVVAYISCCRTALLLCTDRKDFEYFFHHRNSLDISAVLKESDRLMENTPSEIHPASALGDFQPLTQGRYPILNKHPAFKVEYQTQQCKTVCQQEMEYFRESQERQQVQFKTWCKQQELLLQRPEERGRIQQKEEMMLTEQRVSLATQKRNLDSESRRLFHKHQQDQQKSLEENHQKKSAFGDHETAGAIPDAQQFEQLLGKEPESLQAGLEAEMPTHSTEMEHSASQKHFHTVEAVVVKSRKQLDRSLDAVSKKEMDADFGALIHRVEKGKKRQELRKISKQAQIENGGKLISPVHAQGTLISQEVEQMAKCCDKLQRNLGASPSHMKRRRSSRKCDSKCENTNVAKNNQSPSEETTSYWQRWKLHHKERKLLQEIRELRFELAAKATESSSAHYSDSLRKT